MTPPHQAAGGSTFTELQLASLFVVLVLAILLQQWFFGSDGAERGERRPSRQRDESEKGAVGEPTWGSGEGLITQHRVAGVGIGIGIGVGVRVARLRGGVVEDVLASPKFKLFRQRQAFLLVPHLLALLLELPERRQRGIRDAGNDCDRCVAAPGTWLHGTR